MQVDSLDDEQVELIREGILRRFAVIFEKQGVEPAVADCVLDKLRVLSVDKFTALNESEAVATREFEDLAKSCLDAKADEAG